MENSTDNYIIFKSQTPGFSPFAITAEKVLAGSSASSISDKNVNVVSDDLYNNKVAVDDNKQFNVPEKNRMWILIAAILLIGLFTTAYVYLNRKHN
ncbi:MAG: hypothetical protein H5T43_09745, partial [Methanomethylovorans sp.]|jgi:hypothetical protein|nr:hypothetical protein [Methanomethylovorans sp.]